jgi:hypothetical protein
MGSTGYQVGLGDEEVKILVEILKYAVDYCPLESLSEEVNITGEKIEDIIAKLEKALKSA